MDETKLRLLLVPGALALAFCMPGSAGAHDLSPKGACARLKAAVARINSAPHGAAEYHCERSETTAGYYVFALRSNFPAPPGAKDWTGSALVGWFAVSRPAGEIFEWNVGEGVVGAKLADSIQPK